MSARGPLLPRAALARVLEGRLRAEIAAAAHLRNAPPRRLPAGPWPEGVMIGEGEPGQSLDCDSLEQLWLAGAVAEMFHLDEAAQALVQGDRFGDWLDAVAAGWTGERITFLTSGSSGSPKPCVHSMSDLLTEVEALGGLFGERARILSAVPAHHIYGFLFTVLLPARLGATVEPFGAGALRAGDLVVSFPDHWALLARSYASFPSGVAGVTSTAPCPPELVRRLGEAGLSPFVEVYGSSETAGLGARRFPDAAYTLFPHWRFGEPAEDGREEVIHASGRRLLTMDRLTRAGERGFVPAGRADGVVQVGGVNVDPKAVAAKLSRHPLVREAAVRPLWEDAGARLKAFVVPAEDGDPDRVRDELDAWARATLPAAERPVSVTVGASLPTTAMGKPTDW